VRRTVLAAAAGISSSTRWAERVLAFSAGSSPAGRFTHWKAVAASAALKRVVFSHWMARDPTRCRPSRSRVPARHQLHTDTDSAWRALSRTPTRRPAPYAPSLVLWGANDNQLPLEDAFAVARRLHAPVE
jgi:pimeloyl-ACP methyl ester carboxylesterase